MRPPRDLGFLLGLQLGCIQVVLLVTTGEFIWLAVDPIWPGPVRWWCGVGYGISCVVFGGLWKNRFGWALTPRSPGFKRAVERMGGE